MSSEAKNQSKGVLSEEELERFVAIVVAFLQKQRKHYVRVMKAQGDARASAYMKEGWDIFSAHIYERVATRNSQGHPTNVILETVYLMVEPEDISQVSMLSPATEMVIAPPQPVEEATPEEEAPPENVIEKRGPGRPSKEKILV